MATNTRGNTANHLPRVTVSVREEQMQRIKQLAAEDGFSLGAQARILISIGLRHYDAR